jgi:hypothetical protein
LSFRCPQVDSLSLRFPCFHHVIALQIYELKTVEDFWGVYNNILSASQIPNSANFHLFVKGVKPMWEDAVNKEGGKWTFNQKRGGRGQEVNPAILDEKWLNTVLLLLGEQFEGADNAEVRQLITHSSPPTWTLFFFFVAFCDSLLASSSSSSSHTQVSIAPMCIQSRWCPDSLVDNDNIRNCQRSLARGTFCALARDPCCSR